jgi:hypothetical protein
MSELRLIDAAILLNRTGSMRESVLSVGADKPNRTQNESSPINLEARFAAAVPIQTGVIINAPLEAVWSFSMDLTKIPEFHRRVVKVDLLSGGTLREPGASYQCHLSGGMHTCIEKDIEIVPPAEDRHCVLGGHIQYQQDSQRLQSGNDVPNARPSVNQGGN